MEKIVDTVLKWALPAVTAFAVFLFSQIVAIKDDMQRLRQEYVDYQKIGEIELARVKELT